MIHKWICFFLAFIMVTGVLFADILYLKNGQTIRGTVTVKGDQYIVDMGYGKAIFEKADVLRLEKEDLAEFHKKNAFELLKGKKFPQALDQAELWKKKGGDVAELEGFQRKYFLGAGIYLLDRGAFGKAEDVLKELTASPERTRLQERIDTFRKKTDALMANASNYYKTGRYLAALNSYREIFFHCPEMLAKIRRDFSDSCIKAGEILYKKGEFDKADTLYSSGFSIDPELFLLLKDKWAAAKIESFRMNPQQKGNDSLIRALADLVPENLSVLHLAASASYEKGDLRQAYSYFAEISGNPPLTKNKLPESNLLKEVKDKANLILQKRTVHEPRELIKDEESGYYILPDSIFVVSSKEKETIQKAYVVLNHFFRNLQEQFSDPETAASMKRMVCAVLIFPDKASYKTAAGSDAEQGNTKLIISEGKLDSITIFSHEKADGLFLSVLAHELGHAVLSYLTLDNGKVPLCIQEGFAVYSEPHFKKKYYTDLLRNYLAQRKIPSLSSLLSAESYPGNQSLFYALSYSIADAFISEEGADGFIRFVKELKSLSIDQALKKHSKWNSSVSFEKYWRLYIKQKLIKRKT